MIDITMSFEPRVYCEFQNLYCNEYKLHLVKPANMSCSDVGLKLDCQESKRMNDRVIHMSSFVPTYLSGKKSKTTKSTDKFAIFTHYYCIKNVQQSKISTWSAASSSGVQSAHKTYGSMSRGGQQR